MDTTKRRLKLEPPLCYYCPSCLFDFPRVVRFEQLGKVVVWLLVRNLVDLLSHSFIVGGGFYITDYAESYGEVRAFHEGKFQLQGVVQAVGNLNENIVLSNAVLTNLHDLKAKALLNES